MLPLSATLLASIVVVFYNDITPGLGSIDLTIKVWLLNETNLASLSMTLVGYVGDD